MDSDFRNWKALSEDSDIHVRHGHTDTARGTTKVYVYERTFDFSEDDVLYVKSVFHEKYPQLPKLFDDRFDSYLSQLGKQHSSQ